MRTRLEIRSPSGRQDARPLRQPGWLPLPWRGCQVAPLLSGPEHETGETSSCGMEPAECVAPKMPANGIGARDHLGACPTTSRRGYEPERCSCWLGRGDASSVGVAATPSSPVPASQPNRAWEQCDGGGAFTLRRRGAATRPLHNCIVPDETVSNLMFCSSPREEPVGRGLRRGEFHIKRTSSPRPCP